MFSIVGNRQSECGTFSFLKNWGAVFQKTMSEHRLDRRRYSRSRQIGQRYQQTSRGCVETSGTGSSHGSSSVNAEDRLGPS